MNVFISGHLSLPYRNKCLVTLVYHNLRRLYCTFFSLKPLLRIRNNTVPIPFHNKSQLVRIYCAIFVCLSHDDLFHNTFKYYSVKLIQNITISKCFLKRSHSLAHILLIGNIILKEFYRVLRLLNFHGKLFILFIICLFGKTIIKVYIRKFLSSLLQIIKSFLLFFESCNR